MDNLQAKAKRLRSLKNGVGIQRLLNEVYKITKNPIAVHNTEYNLMAYINSNNRDPLWNELITLGTFSYETQKFFDEEGVVELVANSRTIAFMQNSKLEYDRFLGKLFNKDGVHVANFVAVGCETPFDADDFETYEAVCEVLSKEIIKSEFYQTYGMIYQETYIRKLIEGSISDKTLYAAHVQIVYDGLKPYLSLAVVDISKSKTEDAGLAYFRDMFKQLYPGFKYSTYDGYIIIIINTDSAELNIKTDLKKLLNVFERENLYAGISSRFENLYSLAAYYSEAVTALNEGLKSGGSGRVFLAG